MKHVVGKRTNHVAAVARSTDILEDHIGLERLVFFSDAVFAIAITLLALEIRLPTTIDLESNEQLFRALLDLGPKYLSYTISFLVIGSFWMVHHRSFRHIARYNRRLILLNLLLLMVVAFIPFPTTVVGESSSRVATIFYALTMTVAGLLSSTIWLYAYHDGRLIEQRLPSAAFRQGLARSLVVPTIFLLSIGVAYIDNSLARYVWILIAVIALVLRQVTHQKG